MQRLNTEATLTILVYINFAALYEMHEPECRVFLGILKEICRAHVRRCVDAYCRRVA